MNLRRLNDQGVEQFRQFLESLRHDPQTKAPMQLLEDSAASEALPVTIRIEYRPFETRLELARYLHETLTDRELIGLDSDVGLWTWLTLYYFGQLCPVGRNVAVTATYIPVVDERTRYYRHLLLGPYVMYRTYRHDETKLYSLLSNPVYVSTSETYRLFIENPTLIACPAVLATTNALYFDREAMKLRRGAGSKVAGGCRRLIDFLQQIDCTYDLPMLSEEQLIQMLPKEFKRLLAAATAANN